VVISAIGGTAGVGKTALAVHWAHQIAERFPHGTLYIDLQGFGPAGVPVAPDDALRGFLDALNVPTGQRPTGLENLAGLYRSILAERAVLVVLDNARDAEQVRPLLPAGPSCLAVVTSRGELTGLAATHGAHLLALDVLSAADAGTLLAGRLGQDRVTAEQDAATELIGLCARLPLALSITAARAAARPGSALAALAAELRSVPERLDALDAGDPASDMRAVLSWSYRNLTGPAAQMFRLIGIHPGPDISVTAAASLAGLLPRPARRLLAELTGAGLLREHAQGRYGYHDLLRAYAAERAHAVPGGCDATERRAAIHRMLDHYLHTAHGAARLLAPARHPLSLAPPKPGVTVERFADRGSALSWLETEHRVLLAVAALAAELGFDSHAWQLPWAQANYLDLQGHWTDWAATQRIALAAAEHLGDRVGQAHSNRSIGCACMRLGSFVEARGHLDRAIGLFAEVGDTAGLARTWLNIAHTFERQGQYDEALSHARKAMVLTEAAGDRAGQASVLNAIGWCHLQLSEYDSALACCQRALRLYRALGDRVGEADTLDSLGYAHHHLGRYDQAVACCLRAADLNRDLGNRFSESEALMHLGDTHHAAGLPDAARDAWRQALVILDELHHPGADELRLKLRRVGAEARASAI
jgi:tetratricopeptide (TPR) repeat protein